MRIKVILIGGAVAAALGYVGWQAYGSLNADAADPKPAEAAVPAGPTRIVALGRLAPRDGLRHIAGPSKPSVVIGKVLIEENDPVQAGQVIAVLDGVPVLKIELARLQAVLHNTKEEYDRQEKLYRQNSISKSERDSPTSPRRRSTRSRGATSST